MNRWKVKYEATNYLKQGLVTARLEQEYELSCESFLTAYNHIKKILYKEYSGVKITYLELLT